MKGKSSLWVNNNWSFRNCPDIDRHYPDQSVHINKTSAEVLTVLTDFGFKIAAHSQDSTGNFITWTLVRKEPFLVIRRKILWNLWIVIITVNLMKQNLYPQMFLRENTCMKPNPATWLTVCRGRYPVLLVSTFKIFVYSDVKI